MSLTYELKLIAPVNASITSRKKTVCNPIIKKNDQLITQEHAYWFRQHDFFFFFKFTVKHEEKMGNGGNCLLD